MFLDKISLIAFGNPSDLVVGNPYGKAVVGTRVFKPEFALQPVFCELDVTDGFSIKIDGAKLVSSSEQIV
jgi:hypothetical protein